MPRSKASPAEVEERFWSRTLAGADGCRLWLGARNLQGYGKLSVEGRFVAAHRFAWERTNGSIPSGMFVLHRCDTPACVEPEHLFLGTAADNTHDMLNKGREARGTRVGGAKLNDAAVDAIRNAAVAGFPQKVIANLYGITQPHVSNLVHGKRWTFPERRAQS